MSLLFLSVGCTKDNTTTTADPIVSTMNPLKGPKTTVVTFTGTDFGEDPNLVQVFFDEIESEIQLITDTEIVVIVPPRSFLGNVRLVIKGVEITGFKFDYEIVDIQVTTFAGNGVNGSTDANGINASFSSPSHISLDASGNFYVTDALSSIRKINPNGDVTIFAGSSVELDFANGTGINARFNFALGSAVDSSGNIYVADFSNHRIRKITPSGVVSTFAGSVQGFVDDIGNNAQFDGPTDIVVDASDNLYVVDFGNQRIRKITADGIVTTVAGSIKGYLDGTSNTAQFNNPTGISIDASGNLYIADSGNFRIRKIDTDAIVSTVAGSALPLNGEEVDESLFIIPRDVTLDRLGNIYITDLGNHSIRKITQDGIITTIAGSEQGFNDSNGATAQFSNPYGILIDDTFTIYVADFDNDRIRKIMQE